MAYRLAALLGIPNPRAMLEVMPWSVFAGWAEFYRLEPWGSAVEFWRTGIICATAAQLHGIDVGPAEFMPDLDAVEDEPTTLGGPKKTPDQMAALIMTAANQASAAEHGAEHGTRDR